MGERRANVAYRERMHDIPIIEEAKALKVYIIAAEKERYYERNILHFQCTDVMNKFYYGDLWA